jgi:tetratricopeptide (TPR) repeat protein
MVSSRNLSLSEKKLLPSSISLPWIWLLALTFSLTVVQPTFARQNDPGQTRIHIANAHRTIDDARRLNLNDKEVGRLWALIASDEQDLGQFDKAEDAYLHALHLFESQPSLQEDYAVTLDNLGALYTLTQRGEASLNCRKRALAIFQKLGNPLQVARAEGHLSGAYLMLGKNKDARHHAEIASRELALLPEATSEDKASVLVGYALSSCFTGRCNEGVIAARQAMSLVQGAFAPESFPMGQVHVVLGFTEWKTGEEAKAEQDLREGIRILRLNLPPFHPLVVHALEIYRRYLSDLHREVEAQRIAEQQKDGETSQSRCDNCTVSVYGLRGR